MTGKLLQMIPQITRMFINVVALVVVAFSQERLNCRKIFVFKGFHNLLANVRVYPPAPTQRTPQHEKGGDK